MAIKLIKTYSPNENATRLKQQEQDAQTIEDALNKQSSDLDTHENAKIAHSASQISYEGTNVDTALKAVNAYVDNLVIEASKGDSNAEVVAARTNYDGTTDTSLKNRLDRYAQRTDNGQLFKLTTDEGFATSVTSGDLNDLTTPGFYYLIPGTDATNPTILNMPIYRTAFLQVIKSNNNSGTLQIFIPYRSSATSNDYKNIYYRNFGVGADAWMPWAAVADKATTEAAIAAINSESININKSQLTLTNATASGDTYPIGVTVQTVNDEGKTGFPMTYGFAMTIKYSSGRMAQHFMGAGNNVGYTGGWVRTYYSTTGWSKWHSLFGNNSWCNVSVTNEQTLIQSATQKVKFDRVISDSHTQFNTSNNRFIAKVRGMYMVGTGLYINRKKQYNNVELNLYKNGTRYKVIHQNRQDPYNPAADKFNQGHYASGVTVPLEVGDYIEMFIFVGAGQDLTITANSGWYNYFDIYRIGDIPMRI
ncbi:pyocin knob domain-containing protein [Bacillus subtilis]|uniref:pyocin knob domain-containing protein n=1 Tax=Bacillus subtilis TaxID=1423 RepID=UPI002930A8BC|nr:pyocin knob domain-containing protein [Bacillus subtilis]WOA21199.1 pyocin knob domain-containing protein [Bacillus subtilis]